MLPVLVVTGCGGGNGTEGDGGIDAIDVIDALPDGDVIVEMDDGDLPGDAPELCGNGAIDEGEECDGTNLGGATCESLGLGTGSLACTGACSYDTTGCIATDCGNGTIDTGEECDGTELGGATCEGEGYPLGGTLECTPGCTLDLSGCCGDGSVGGTEPCDDANDVPWDGCDHCEVTEFQVNTYTTGRQMNPKVAMASDGSAAVVVWQSEDQDGDGWGVYAQRYGSGGSPVGAEFRVSSYTANDQEDPDVAMLDDGSFIVVWTSTEQMGDPFEGIFARRFDGSGSPLGDDFHVNTTSVNREQFPSIDMADDGMFVVTWTGGDVTTLGEILAQRFLPTGSPAGAEFHVNTTVLSNQQDSVVAVDSDGDFVIVWESGGSTTDCDVFGRAYQSTGVPLTGEFLVNTYTTDGQSDASVSMAADGSFVATWTSRWQDGSDDGAYGQRYSSGGTPDGVEFRINTYTERHQFSPVIDIAADGRSVIVWGSIHQDGDMAGIFARRYDPLGWPMGSEFQVNQFTAGPQEAAAVAITSDGRCMIAWYSQDQDGDSHGIFGQRYDISGNAIGLEPW